MVDKKMNKEAKHVLDQALRVLEFTMEIAVQSKDIDAMIAVSDRLMILYQHLAEGDVKKFKPGFAIGQKEEVHDESD
jgi:hypothetical protein